MLTTCTGAPCLAALPGLATYPTGCAAALPPLAIEPLRLPFTLADAGLTLALEETKSAEEPVGGLWMLADAGLLGLFPEVPA
jgi:hypothetical protein